MVNSEKKLDISFLLGYNCFHQVEKKTEVEKKMTTTTTTTERKPVMGDRIELAAGWYLLYEGYSRPCVFFSPLGEKYFCEYGTTEVTVPLHREREGMKRQTFKVSSVEIETFNRVVNYLISEIARVAADAAYVARITRESGLTPIVCGRKEAYLTARWAGEGGKFYFYLSEGSLGSGSGGKIFVSVEQKGREDVTFWVLGREAALQKILRLVAEAGMKWRNGRWESSVKPTLSIPGVDEK